MNKNYPTNQLESAVSAIDRIEAALARLSKALEQEKADVEKLGCQRLAAWDTLPSSSRMLLGSGIRKRNSQRVKYHRAGT